MTMTDTLRPRSSLIDWSVAAQTAPGEKVSGDLHVVAPWAEGVLVGVVDGLGHGEAATVAARAAVAVLEQGAGKPLVALVQQCHEALRQTRGVVMTLVAIDATEETISAIGIGNVETLLLRANPRITPRRTNVLLRGGVVGYQLPALQVETHPIARGDIVVLCTDGIREDFADLVKTELSPAQLAQHIMTQRCRGTDDALALALKYTAP